MKHHRVVLGFLVALGCMAEMRLIGHLVVASEPAVQAVEFKSQVVYRSKRPPGYAAWVSFFPGENGQWYIGCEEVSRPDQPFPQTSPERWFGMGLPAGYDKSQ